MLLVYTPKITSRILYIFNHIFNRMISFEINVTNSIEDFVAHNGPKFSYSTKPLGNELFFFCCPFLIDHGIQNISINVSSKKKYPIFFSVTKKSAMEFDVFAASFYLISRYEEYLPHLKDHKGRFKFKESLAFKNSFLDKPIVDLWINDLKIIINKKFKNAIKDEFSNKRIIPILEVPEAYLFSNKSLIMSVIQSLTLIWNLKFKNFINQIYVLLRFRKDPYLEYDFIINELKKYQIDLLSFFRFSKNIEDSNSISIFNSSFRLLIKNISDKVSVSLLVSVFAQKELIALKNEMNNLTNLIHRNIRKVRLYDGILSISEIYPMLIQNEVTEDYSMGYSDKIGYRASTSVPFYFYDLVNEVQSPLKIFPVVITENSLREFSNEKAFNIMKKYHLKSPLKNSVFSFAFSPSLLSKSPDNLHWHSSFLEYISGYENLK